VATLLLIDDDSVVLGNLYDLFCDVYDCHTADRAEQALEYLEIQKYDVVLTDIAMPGLGGIEILKRIKEHHATTPVIVISSIDVEEKDKLLEMGIFAFLPKPFKLEEVEDAVVRAIGYRPAGSPAGQPGWGASVSPIIELLKEIPLSAVLKEKIAAIEAKYAATEAENATLKDDLRKAKGEIETLKNQTGQH
jgi:DNA-binding NtrC family response regulator